VSVPRNRTAWRVAREDADRLTRRIVSQRGACQRCRGMGTDTAHIIGRRYGAVRCDTRNCWWLCRRCHQIVDQDVAAHHRLVVDTIGLELYGELRRTAHRGLPEPAALFWPATVRRLAREAAGHGLRV
jgi:hypothetical protein